MLAELLTILTALLTQSFRNHIQFVLKIARLKKYPACTDLFFIHCWVLRISIIFQMFLFCQFIFPGLTMSSPTRESVLGLYADSKSAKGEGHPAKTRHSAFPGFSGHSSGMNGSEAIQVSSHGSSELSCNILFQFHCKFTDGRKNAVEQCQNNSQKVENFLVKCSQFSCSQLSIKQNFTKFRITQFETEFWVPSDYQSFLKAFRTRYIIRDLIPPRSVLYGDFY